jgi:hypothetical protein
MDGGAPRAEMGYCHKTKIFKAIRSAFDNYRLILFARLEKTLMPQMFAESDPEKLRIRKRKVAACRRTRLTYIIHSQQIRPKLIEQTGAAQHPISHGRWR